MPDSGYAFRLKAFARPDLAAEKDGVHSTTVYGRDGTRLEITVRDEQTPWRSVVAVVGRGYRTREDAQRAGLDARDDLRRAALAADISMDVGRDKPRGLSLSTAARLAAWEASGACVVGDAHGLKVFDDLGGPVRPMSMNARGRVGRDHSTRLIDEFAASAGLAADRLGQRLALAVDLYLQGGAGLSAEGSLLGLLTALEAVSERRRQPDEVLALIDGFRQQVDQLAEAAATDTVDAPDLSRSLESLKGSLGQLRNESIGLAIVNLAEDHVADEELTHWEGSVASFVKECYRVRSVIVHGADLDRDLSEACQSLQYDLRHVTRQVLEGLVDREAAST